jgi:hypothetical protein
MLLVLKDSTTNRTKDIVIVIFLRFLVFEKRLELKNATFLSENFNFLIEPDQNICKFGNGILKWRFEANLP